MLFWTQKGEQCAIQKTLYGGDRWQAGGRSCGLQATILESLSFVSFVLFNGNL
jgi:hypothetical protein